MESSSLKNLDFYRKQKDPDLQKSRPKRQTSARSRSLSYTVWFDSVLLLCLDTQCTISSCIATGFFPVKCLPEADMMLQKIIPCIHRIKPLPRIRSLPQNRIYGFALWQNFVAGQPSSSFKGQKFSSSALSCESVMFKIEITTFAFRLLYNCFVSCYMEGHLHYNICPMKHGFHWHFYLPSPLENKGICNEKLPFLLYPAKVSLFLLKYHWYPLPSKPFYS